MTPVNNAHVDAQARDVVVAVLRAAAATDFTESNALTGVVRPDVLRARGRLRHAAAEFVKTAHTDPAALDRARGDATGSPGNALGYVVDYLADHGDPITRELIAIARATAEAADTDDPDTDDPESDHTDTATG